MFLIVWKTLVCITYSSFCWRNDGILAILHLILQSIEYKLRENIFVNQDLF